MFGDWCQDVADQHGVVREYTNWSPEIETAPTVGLDVERGVGVLDESVVVAHDEELWDVPLGDRLDNDIGPAKRAGWGTARILQGFSRNQEPRNLAERPDITFDSIAHLKELT
jgi:hypothetical protein